MAPISRKPDPRRQMQGKINRAEGKEFEKRIQEAFDYVNARGAAVINKVPEPIKIIKRLEAGQFIAVFEKKAQPDYEGTLKGGRSVLYEGPVSPILYIFSLIIQPPKAKPFCLLHRIYHSIRIFLQRMLRHRGRDGIARPNILRKGNYTCS